MAFELQDLSKKIGEKVGAQVGQKLDALLDKDKKENKEEADLDAGASVEATPKKKTPPKKTREVKTKEPEPSAEIKKEEPEIKAGDLGLKRVEEKKESIGVTIEDIKKDAQEKENKGDFLGAADVYSTLGDISKEKDLLEKAKNNVSGSPEEKDRALKEINSRIEILEDLKKFRKEKESEKAPAVPEAEISPERMKARQDYVNAQIAYEKAGKSIGIMDRIREFLGSKSETKGAAGDEQKTAEENLKKAEDNLKTAIGGYRQEMVEIKEKELAENVGMTEETRGEELEKYTRQIAIETTVKEATEIYLLKKETEIEISTEDKGKLLWLKTKGLEAAQWYRQQSTKQKIGVSVALIGVGVTAGIAGGAIGAALAGGVLTGRWTQRVLSGAGTAVGLETWMKSSQKKAAEKEVLKTSDFIEYLEKRGMEVSLESQNERLDKRLFELIGRQKGEERRRYLIAGMAGVVIGSGALSRAFREIVPDEWKSAVMGKLGFGRPAVPVEEPSSAILPGEVETPGAAPGVLPESPPIITTPAAPPEISEAGVPANVPAAAVEPDTWGQISGLEVAHKGDSVWKMLEKQMDSRLGDDFDSLDKAQKIYIIDALKDKIAADPEKFGLTDIDKIPVGQKIDFSDIFQDRTEVKDIVSKAVNLRPEQLENILKESEAFKEKLAAKATEVVIPVSAPPLLEPEQQLVPEAVPPPAPIPKVEEILPDKVITSEAAAPESAISQVVPEEFISPEIAYKPILLGEAPLTSEKMEIREALYYGLSSDGSTTRTFREHSKIISALREAGTDKDWMNRLIQEDTETALREAKPGSYNGTLLEYEFKRLGTLFGALPEEPKEFYEIQRYLTGNENLNMDGFKEVVSNSSWIQLTAENLRNHSRIISGYLDQLGKMDPNSSEAGTVKDAIRKIVEMDEKVYKTKKLFSPAIKKLLEK